MAKLTDTQLIVLTAAAGRDDGSILPLPNAIRGGAVTKVVDALIARGLAERIEDERIAVDDLVRITRAGLVAINADPDDGAQVATDAHGDEDGVAAPEPEVATTGADEATQAATVTDEPARKPKRAPRRKRKGTKLQLLIEMLRRPEGASIDQIAEATEWRNHSIRGAISGALKKKLGLTVTSEKVEGTRIYRIPA